MSANNVMWGFRTDTELAQKINDFKDKEGFTSSQAVRILIEMGLSNSAKLDVSWARAAYREGVFKGLDDIRQRITGTPFAPAK